MGALSLPVRFKGSKYHQFSVGELNRTTNYELISSTKCIEYNQSSVLINLYKLHYR